MVDGRRESGGRSSVREYSKARIDAHLEPSLTICGIGPKIYAILELLACG